MATVLIVEDDQGARDLLISLVNLLGHEALSHYQAEGVLEMLGGDSTPALAIIDINLPEHHGVSLTWDLRKEWPDLPIIIASAVLPQWDEDDLIDCGADLMLEKPYDMQRLSEAIKVFLEFGRNGMTRLSG